MNIALLVEVLCLFRISKMSQEALIYLLIAISTMDDQKIAEKSQFASLKIFFARLE